MKVLVTDGLDPAALAALRKAHDVEARDRHTLEQDELQLGRELGGGNQVGDDARGVGAVAPHFSDHDAVEPQPRPNAMAI